MSIWTDKLFMTQNTTAAEAIQQTSVTRLAHGKVNDMFEVSHFL
jgi:hypothetical protein